MILAAAVLAIGFAEERIPNKQIQHVARFILKKRVHEIRVSGIWARGRQKLKLPLASPTSERRPEVIRQILVALTRSTRQVGEEGYEIEEPRRWAGTFYFVWREKGVNKMMPFWIDVDPLSVGKEVNDLYEKYFLGPPPE
jgi:hypothetical protein